MYFPSWRIKYIKNKSKLSITAQIYRKIKQQEQTYWIKSLLLKNLYFTVTTDGGKSGS